MSGEEYRQELRQALQNPAVAEQIRALPWGSGSGLMREGASPGYVFCARIGDHERVQFRYIETRDPASPVIIADTLACLAQARCPEGMAAKRAPDDETYRQAFGAWDIARHDIVVEWNRASDPANLVTPVPAIMHRAADLVRAHKPADMTVEEADWLLDALQAPYPERIQREVRRIVIGDEPKARKVHGLAGPVYRAGSSSAAP